MATLEEVDGWLPAKRSVAYRDFLEYAFGLVPYTDLTRRYGANFVQSLSRDGTLLFEAKPYVYNRACGFQLSAGDYALSPDQKRRLRAAVDGSKTLPTHLSKLWKKSYPALLPEDLRLLTGEILSSKEFNTFLSKFSYRKMTFLASTYGVKHEDLISDMKLSACYAILRAYPAYSNKLHVLNIGKTAAHNRGVNLIYEHTAQSRNRLSTSTAGGVGVYNATTFSLEELQETSANQGVLILDHHNLIVDAKESERTIDTTLAFTQLEDCLPPKKRALIQLLRGIHDDEFSTYLGEDNEDFADRVSHEILLRKACVFLNIKPIDATNWLRSLRNIL